MLSQFQDALNDFKEEGSKSSEQFQYWSLFLEEIARVKRSDKVTPRGELAFALVLFHCPLLLIARITADVHLPIMKIV